MANFSTYGRMSPASICSTYKPIRFLDEMGFYLSDHGFKGPFISVEDIKAGKPIKLANVNLYCVKKTLRDATLKNGSGGRRLFFDIDGYTSWYM